jgi:hypothetical protein
MAITAYGPYSVSTDIPSGKVDVASLETQIRASNIKTAVEAIERSGDVLSVTFKDALDATDKALLDGSSSQPPNHPCTPGSLLGNHTGEPVPDQGYTEKGNPIVGMENVQTDGVPRFVSAPRVVSEAVYASHNYCDPTTWYSQSMRVANEAAADSGDGLTWNLAEALLIDLTHGKVFDEEGISGDQQILDPGDPHGYLITVRVDGSPVDARPPFASDWSQGGDYYVDYVSGDVIFQATQAGKDVRVDYSYAGGAQWILNPIGNALFIEKAEIQFSIDVDFKATIKMQALGPVETFAPQLWDQQTPAWPVLLPQGTTLPPASGASPGAFFYETTTPQLYALDSSDPDPANWTWVPVPAGPLPSGYLVPLETTLYKSFDQLIDEAISAFPQIPVFTNTVPPRGFLSPKHIFQFHYASAKPFYPSLGMQLWIGLDPELSTPSATALGGERATATFYMTASPDPGPTQAARELGIG